MVPANEANEYAGNPLVNETANSPLTAQAGYYYAKNADGAVTPIVKLSNPSWDRRFVPRLSRTKGQIAMGQEGLDPDHQLYSTDDA